MELDENGRSLRSAAVAGNLEDVAVHTPSGALLLLVESPSELVLYDPDARQERRRWRLDDAALLGRRPEGKKQGFEGLAFREEAGKPGGGVLYLVHQTSPAMIVGLSFDPSASAAPGDEDVVARFAVPGHEDLSATTYVPSLDRLLVVADQKDLLLVMAMDGRVQAEVPLPGVQQEGLCLDAGGNLWVADDRGGALLRFDGASKALGAVAEASTMAADGKEKKKKSKKDRSGP